MLHDLWNFRDPSWEVCFFAICIGHPELIFKDDEQGQSFRVGNSLETGGEE